MKALIRASSDVIVVSGEVWNQLCDMVERCYNMTVAAPLGMHDSDSGRALYSTASADVFPVTLTKTSGSAGSKTTAVSFVYTVKTVGGNQIDTGIAPVWPSRSENGLRVQATSGLGWYDSGALKVFAFEASGTTGCP